MAASSEAPAQVDSDEPIFTLASQCDDILQACLQLTAAAPSPRQYGVERSLVEDYERRFIAWWEYLGVFANKKSNLDQKLRRHVHIRDVVLRLLVVLGRNLGLLKAWLSQGLSKGNASGSQSSDVEMMEADLFEVATEAIDESLSELGRVGLAIRNSAKVTETVSARRFAAAKTDLAAFEGLAFSAIEALYPNAPESLLMHLSRGMTDRYARLLYRASRSGLRQKDARREKADVSQSGAASLQPAPIESGPSKPLLASAVEEAPEPATQVSITKSEAASALAPTSVDPDQFRQKLANILRQQKSRSGGTTAIIGRTVEPPLPQFDDLGQAKCPWCFITISQTFVNGNKWSAFGRDHYRNDLEPFPCLSEDCEEQAPIFSSVTAWKNHMMDHHYAWTQLIHREPMWKCPQSCHESEVLFPSADHLYSHLRSLHPADFEGQSERDLLRITNLSMTDGSRERHVCPFCRFKVESHQPAEVQALPVRSLKRPLAKKPDLQQEQSDNGPKKGRMHSSDGYNDSITTGDTQRQPTSGVTQAHSTGPIAQGEDLPFQGPHQPAEGSSEALAPISRAMETHISRHLQFLMVLSLRLIDAHCQSETADHQIPSDGSSPAQSIHLSEDDSSSDNLFEDLRSIPSGTPSCASGIDLIHDDVELDDAEDLEWVDWATLSGQLSLETSAPDIESDPILSHFKSSRATHTYQTTFPAPLERWRYSSSHLRYLDSLRLPEMEKYYFPVARPPLMHDWAFEHPLFKMWRDQSRARDAVEPSDFRFLWIKGAESDITSFMMSLPDTIIGREGHSANNIAVFSAKPQRDDDPAPTAVAMLRAVFYQWFCKDPAWIDKFKARYRPNDLDGSRVDSHQQPEWWDYLVHHCYDGELYMRLREQRPMLVLHGLDAFESPSEVIRLVECLCARIQLQACVSSRPSLSSLSNAIEICLDSAVNNTLHFTNDVPGISSVLAGLMRKSGPLSELVKTKAQGSIILAAVVGNWAEALIENGEGSASVHSSILGCPDTVESLIRDLCEDDEARLLLDLFCHAAANSPLSPEELYLMVMLVHEPQAIDKLESLDECRDACQLFIRRTSKGLLNINQDSVALIHPSLRTIMETSVDGGLASRVPVYIDAIQTAQMPVPGMNLTPKQLFLSKLTQHLLALGEEVIATGAQLVKRLHQDAELFQKFAEVHSWHESQPDSNCRGGPLLHILIRHSLPQLVYCVLELGANVDELSPRMETPLQVAALLGKIYCQMLLEHGADVIVDGDKSFITIAVAIRAADVSTVALLLQAGARPHVMAFPGTKALCQPVSEALLVLAKTLPGEAQAIAQHLFRYVADVKTLKEVLPPFPFAFDFAAASNPPNSSVYVPDSCPEVSRLDAARRCFRREFPTPFLCNAREFVLECCDDVQSYDMRGILRRGFRKILLLFDDLVSQQRISDMIWDAMYILFRDVHWTVDGHDLIYFDNFFCRLNYHLELVFMALPHRPEESNTNASAMFRSFVMGSLADAIWYHQLWKRMLGCIIPLKPTIKDLDMSSGSTVERRPQTPVHLAQASLEESRRRILLEAEIIEEDQMQEWFMEFHTDPKEGEHRGNEEHNQDGGRKETLLRLKREAAEADAIIRAREERMELRAEKASRTNEGRTENNEEHSRHPKWGTRFRFPVQSLNLPKPEHLRPHIIFEELDEATFVERFGRRQDSEHDMDIDNAESVIDDGSSSLQEIPEREREPDEPPRRPATSYHWH